MANQIIKIKNYSIKSDDVFFFDNNIWMYLFCPIGSYNIKRQHEYSKFLNYVISRGNHIFINSLVLSEFSNRYLRLDFELENRKVFKYANFKKDYMPSVQCASTIGNIKSELTKIVALCQKGNDDFNAISLPDIFKLFTIIGFNDSYYIYLASKKNWKVVSDDSDFSNNRIPDKNLTILTF